MLLIVVLICVGFGLLFKGGDFLVTGAAGIAQKKNIPPFIVGITLVAFGTSAPELFFNIISALHGNAAFALSNVSGSNLINICIGIGVSAMIARLPIPRQKFVKDLVFLFGGPLLIVLFIVFSSRSALTWVHGLLLFVGFGTYLFLTKKELTRQSNLLPPTAEGSVKESCKREWGIFLLGGVMLYIGGEIIFRNALAIVDRLQISESIVGLTVIAVGTSIPDCAASIIAVMKHQKDIAIGNILGSNIFNIFLVLGATILAYQAPIMFDPSHFFDYLSVTLLSLLLFSVVMVRQSYGRIIGLMTLAYYPLSLLVRVWYFR
ncbi:MAG: calcium/sodium antiporter [Desulfobacterales bacterium]